MFEGNIRKRGEDLEVNFEWKMKVEGIIYVDKEEKIK